ncbi:hypothetical protein ACVR1G_01990 [Streptococcus dentasini]
MSISGWIALSGVVVTAVGVLVTWATSKSDTSADDIVRFENNQKSVENSISEKTQEIEKTPEKQIPNFLRHKQNETVPEYMERVFNILNSREQGFEYKKLVGEKGFVYLSDDISDLKSNAIASFSDSNGKIWYYHKGLKRINKEAENIMKNIYNGEAKLKKELY